MPNKFISVIRMENVLLFHVCVPPLPSNPQLNSLGKSELHAAHTHAHSLRIFVYLNKNHFTHPIEMNVKV